MHNSVSIETQTKTFIVANLSCRESDCQRRAREIGNRKSADFKLIWFRGAGEFDTMKNSRMNSLLREKEKARGLIELSKIQRHFASSDVATRTVWHRRSW